MTNLLYPEVIDASSLGAAYSSPVYLPIGIEGQAGAAATCVLTQEYLISTANQAQQIFGVGSPLTNLISFVLSQGGVPQVSACASIASATTPTLLQRQAAWAVLEADPNVRVRLTDASDQATLQALATSCNNANLLQNKQIGFGGLPAGTTKATHITTAEALNNNRFVYSAPGIIDNNGVLWSGSYGAALLAAQVATNTNIADDLNLQLVPTFAGIELNTIGQPIFLRRVVSGVVVNDFEDLLQAGVSPWQTNPAGGGLQITHIRTSYSGSPPESDFTYDALMTRLIVDQVFVVVKTYCLSNNYLDDGNTAANRQALATGVTNLLAGLSNWISPVAQADGNTGFAVSVIPSTNLRSVTIQYQGVVVRGIGQIAIDAELTVAV